jgi:hypothetical protein
MPGTWRAAAFVAVGLVAGACGGEGVGDAGPATTAPRTGVDVNATVGGWTAVALVDGTTPDGAVVPHPLTSTVTGIWFADLEHGVVSLHGDGATTTSGGALQSLDAPDHVAATVVDGAGAGPGGAAESWVGLRDTPEGLVALGTAGGVLQVSADRGRTFTARPTSATGVPDAGPVWVSADPAGTWHQMDRIGTVWSSPTPPGGEAAWTRTWQPEASPPEPNPLPAGACTHSFRQGYFATDPQQAFWASDDGATMVYGAGYGAAPAGVCRSTDGGRTFFPVAFPDPPAPGDQSPYVLVFADDLHGIAARADDGLDGGGYVYTTADGGATWAAGTLPVTVDEAGSRAAITAGFCAPAQVDRCWLVGFAGADAHGLLLRTDDGGATWTDLSRGLLPFMETYFVEKLHTGFALDEDHIWLGGARGLLLHSDTGGQ